MKQKRVGLYHCGSFAVELFVKDDIGGYCITRCDETQLARIIIGINCKQWYEVISVLLHEIGELNRIMSLCRYQRDNYYAGDLSSYIFHYDHIQFSDLCEREAMFLSDALPDLAKVWNKYKKDKKKRG